MTHVVSLAVATAELRLRLDRLKMVNARPAPAPRPPVFTVVDRYDALCRRTRAQRVAR